MNIVPNLARTETATSVGGNARRTLEGVSELAGERLSVGVEGHMPYSVFLELGFDGRYAVLQETVNALAPKTLADIAGKLRDLRRDKPRNIKP